MAELFVLWVKSVCAVGVEPDFAVLACVVAAAVVMTASAMLAGQIAESRGHAPHIHMWLGFFLPMIYPGIISKRIKSVIGKDAPKRTEEVVEKLKIAPKKAGISFRETPLTPATEPLPLETPDTSAAATSEAAATESVTVFQSGGVMTKELARKIAVRADGTAAGPFVFTLADGSNVNVFRITDALDAVMAIELEGGNGSVRIPYARIASIVETRKK